MSQTSIFRNQPRPSTSIGRCHPGQGIRFNSGSHSEKLHSFRSEFPNLPGFSKHSTLRPQSPKNQSLHFKNGFMMVNTPLSTRGLSLSSMSIPSLLNRPSTAPCSSSSLSKEVYSPNDVSGRYSLSRQKHDRSSNKKILPFCPSSKLPSFLEHDRRVLLFNAYYEEDVQLSPTETHRILMCEIFFYVEDGTIEIIKRKQANSGIPQGVFLRRNKVLKPNNENASECEYYEINDFKIGNAVEIYSRIFNIMSCNESTKEYVKANHGWHEVDVAPLPFPRDLYAEANKRKMKRESGVPGVDRKRKMHELKEVMESMLGKQSSTTDRGMFLECGQNALCFHAIWDDRERLYGDVQFYRLFYYLADDTVEILPVHGKNDGRYSFPKLLKRSKLPKSGKLPTGDDAADDYHWKELRLGDIINVFGRSMLLAKCDAYTRDHYASNGIELEDASLEPDEDKVDFFRQIPPYNGFGSEEDSLRSCTGGINPPPPKRDLAKMREKLGIILSFTAELLGDEINRSFVIQYFMEDDTIAIREPPMRNSGAMGGKFLRRQSSKKPDGSKLSAKDMFIGNVVDLNCHHFKLLVADEYTYRLMENDSTTFPYSNFNQIHESLQEKKYAFSKYFATEYDVKGKLDIEQLKDICEKVGLYFNSQQIMTFWRKLDKKGKHKISFTKIIKLLANEPV